MCNVLIINILRRVVFGKKEQKICYKPTQTEGMNFHYLLKINCYLP